MASEKTENGIIPFGEGTEEAAVTSTDALTAFLETAALPLIAGLVVGGFLIFQFGRWFMHNYRVTGLSLLSDTDKPGVPAAQTPAERSFRPWNQKGASKR